MNMNKYIKILSVLCVLALLPAIAWAQSSSQTSLYPYAGYLDYGKTQAKSQAVVTGLYGYFGHGTNHSLEGDVAFMRINYDTAGNSEGYDLDQVDMSLVYSNYALSNWKIRGGAHGIISDDVLTDKAYVLFGGLSRYKTYSYEVGVDVYASIYNRFDPDPLHVIQITGTGGYHFGDYYKSGSFFIRTRGHYIRLSDDVGFNKQQYGSVEQSLFYYRGPWTLEGYGWFGEQVFGVQNDGFIVNNLREKYKGAFGGSVQFAITDKLSAKLDVSHGRFQELEQTRTSQVQKYLFMLGYTF